MHWVVQHLELTLSVVGIILGIGFSIYYGRQSRRRDSKVLGWRLTVDMPILTMAADALPELSLSWQGHKVQRPRVALVWIVNIGGREIKASDYESPISVHFPQSTILSAEASGPSGPIDLRVDGDKAMIAPPLLNPSESLRVALILDGCGGRPTVSTRFAGQTKDIKALWAAQDRYLVPRLIIASGPVLLSTVLASLVTDPSHTGTANFIAVFIFLVTIGWVAAEHVAYRRRRRQFEVSGYFA